ncbi:hypothetical protein FGB62_44g116 [Gracilaria domingensis]|nr:hypothetical protein FGB62_44g116 [Gracilaria domingensis]
MNAFILSPASGALLIRNRNLDPRSPTQTRSRGKARPHYVMSQRTPPRKINWMQMAIVMAGTTMGSSNLSNSRTFSFNPARPVHAATVDAAQNRSNQPIPLEMLGVKREDYLGERELRRRKTTQLSEAEQEIMELEEWEVATQWFRNLQALWAALASVGGIFLLYRGGVMWENWIKEQERKDMEEEIKLTGTFIDPRAVRKDEEKKDGKKRNKPKKDDSASGPSAGPSAPSKDPSDGDLPPGGIDSLEKLFGNS